MPTQKPKMNKEMLELPPITFRGMGKHGTR